MKNILIPTDFSRNAWNAIEYAMEFFKDQRCTFFFLHTYTPSFYRMDYVLGGPSFSAIPDKGLDISQAGLEQTVEKTKMQYANPNHTFEMVSAFNILTDEINEVSRDKDIDLVVMGTQGATGAKEIFLGSNTVYVIRKAAIPLLAIPNNYSFLSINKILFPTDYLTQYKEEELALLIEFTKLHNASVTVLHVQEESGLTESQLEHKNHLRNIVAQIPHTMQELRGANMPDAVIDYAHTFEMDLITMMNRKHSFLERLMVRQNIDQIGFHVKVPLLVIRDTAKIEK